MQRPLHLDDSEFDLSDAFMCFDSYIMPSCAVNAEAEACINWALADYFFMALSPDELQLFHQRLDDTAAASLL